MPSNASFEKGKRTRAMLSWPERTSRAVNDRTHPRQSRRSSPRFRIASMPLYRVYRMKESTRQHFRWAPHVSGKAAVKHRDYEEAGEIDAPSDYAAWAKTRDSGQPLEVGDLLETGPADLRICKY